MTAPTFGRRAAPAADLEFTATAQRTILPEGDHQINISGARAVTGKTGSTSVIITATDADGNALRIRPLLVSSPGGVSTMIEDNRACLVAMAGIPPGKSVKLADLLAKLENVTAGVTVSVSSDQRGQAVNEIVEGWTVS